MNTPSATNAPLKPCPFCGGEAAHATCTITRDRNIRGDKGTFTGYFINCIVCGADNQGIAEGYRTPEQAAERWNHRTAPSESGRSDHEAVRCAIYSRMSGDTQDRNVRTDLIMREIEPYLAKSARE